MNRQWFLVVSVLLFSLVLVACGGAPAAAPEAKEAAPTEAPEAVEAAPTEAPAVQEEAPAEEPAAAEVKDFVTWYQYDQNNEDPASDERVGNEYLRKTIPLFNELVRHPDIANGLYDIHWLERYLSQGEG